ncbi:MAG: hypothetical protein IPG50_29730 [Myxococcales bacterium]|nr:hypothetical protein [Myxococcales bacterium]
MTRVVLLGFVLAAAGASAVVACRELTCEENKTCESGASGNDASTESGAGEGGVGDGGGADGAFPEGCEKSPAEAPETLSEKCGVFVSGTGQDVSPTGSREVPAQSVGRGVQLAKDFARPWVFVCAGSYAESVPVVADSAVSLFGKLDCGAAAADWKVGTKRAVLEGAADAPVLKVDGAKVRVEGMVLRAKDATQAGGSSVCVFANGGELTVVGSVVQAGQGKDGDAGASASADAGARATQGNAASGATGGATQLCQCGSDPTTGGAGGFAAPALLDGGAGTPAYDGGGANNGAGGSGLAVSCLAGGGGADGTGARLGPPGSGQASTAS